MRDGSVMIVGNLCATSPVGMAVVYDDSDGFVIEPQWSGRPEDDAHVPPGTNAPDGSYLERTFRQGEADITIKWGRSGDQAIMAEISATADVELNLVLKSGWKSMPGVWRENGGGIAGLLAGRKGGYVTVSVRTSPAPVNIKAGYRGEAVLTLQLAAGAPVGLVAGVRQNRPGVGGGGESL